VVGRKHISKELRQLIWRMVAEDPTWGAPRIHGELGFDISERTVSRWMKRAPRDSEPAKRWLTFLRNHREAIAAMDFFTVPTITFGLLHSFFVISHDRRRILHFQCDPASDESVGGAASCGRPFHSNRRLDFLSSTGIGNMGLKFPRRSGLSGSFLFVLRSKASGRTASQSAGWKARSVGSTSLP